MPTCYYKSFEAHNDPIEEKIYKGADPLAIVLPNLLPNYLVLTI